MKKGKLALNYLMSQMWALDQTVLSSMADIVSRDDGIELSDLMGITPQALEGESGLAITPRLEIRDSGVGVLHVTGVISRYASLFDDICGGVSTQALAKDFTQAINNPAVSSLVLVFDSPGGDANGIHELAEMIYSARGTKPIKAYIGGTGASAIYWIASACDEVIIDATARLGSIGVVMTLERKKEDASSEYERLEIVSSQSPNKRLDAFSEQGKAVNQSQVDQLADIFIDRVSRNMSVDRETVMSEFGQGGILIGQTAVDKGMAHRLGSLESVINELHKGKKSTMSKNTTAFELPNATTLSAHDFIETLKADRPDVIEALQPAQTMALENAEELVQLCASAGVPALSATLLKKGVTFDAASAQIDTAKGLKAKLAAAGLDASFEALLSCVDNPVELVGKAVHEAQALAAGERDVDHTVTDKQTRSSKALNASEIYKNRR